MTLRGRLALLTSAAVALAIVVASVAAWLLIRSFLLAEVDRQLLDRLPEADNIARMAVTLPPGEMPPGRFVGLLQGDALSIQLVDADGNVVRQITPDDNDLTLDRQTQQLLEGRGDRALWTATIDGRPYRVVSVSLAEDEGMIRLFQPLDGVNSTLTRIAWLLIAVAAGGILLAGMLGRATARAGLRPVDHLVAAAERVAATQDLGHRIALGGDGRDEVARLATSINGMLGALDAARTQQRELVENAGHELRTPLATLRNDLGLLLRSESHTDRGLSQAERATLLHDLEAEADALSELVAEVLNLARGDLELEPFTETDVGALAHRAASRAGRIGPSITVEVEGAGGRASVRPGALERGLINLIRNAVQVSGDGDIVHVNVTVDDGWVWIRVLDRGPGIAAADLPRVFERFYRGAEARERHGSGLGLAIVAQVAAMHGGTAEAANRPGGGAMFTLGVPAQQRSQNS